MCPCRVHYRRRNRLRLRSFGANASAVRRCVYELADLSELCAAANERHVVLVWRGPERSDR